MGWLWSDSSKDTKPPESQTTSTQTPDPPPHDVPSPRPPSKARTTARDAQADAELQKLIEELQYAPSDYPPKSIPSQHTGDPSRPASTPTNTTPTSASTDTARRPIPMSAYPIDPARLLPTNMSCRAAFDQAWHCQLIGGQWAEVYRHGSLRNCSELWSNFWFCMRTNRGYMGDEERAERIQRHYWEREQKYREGPSSEDVWKVRKEPVDGAFQGSWEELDKIMEGQLREKREREAQERERTG